MVINFFDKALQCFRIEQSVTTKSPAHVLKENLLKMLKIILAPEKKSFSTYMDAHFCQAFNQ
jgi:hypothetical protein